MTFQSTLLSWHDFYAITGTAAAGLVGLLFVGLSLHLRTVITHGDVKALARVTLASLGLTLILALFMVIPESNDPSSTGWNLIGLGAGGFLILAPSLVAGLRSTHTTLSFPRLMLRFGFSVVTFLAVIAMGGVMVDGRYQTAFTGLVAISVVLLVGALRNSWELLVTVGAATYEAQRPQVPDVTTSHHAAP